jgi:hypothetical protein
MSALDRDLLLRNGTQLQTTGISGAAPATPSQLRGISSPDVPLDKYLVGSAQASDAALQRCRSYKGLGGLRQAIAAEANNSSPVRCGWRYKLSNGITMLVSQGALGTDAGPVSKDDAVQPGERWTLDLQKAELEISQHLSKQLASCAQLPNLGAQAEFFGFCKTTRAIIPVEKKGGVLQTRFPSRPEFVCDASQIVSSANTSRCPPSQEGFIGQPGERMSLHTTRMRDVKEGFLDEECSTTPLSRDCVVQAVRLAGCDDSGTLISALQKGGTTGATGYDSVLKTLPSYKTYQASSNPRLSEGVLRDGSATLQMALDSFSGLVQNTQAKNDKTRLSAIDLCIRAGEFDKYDFCSEITPTTTITEENLKCAQNIWKKNGGTENGVGYGRLTVRAGVKGYWIGRSFGALEEYTKQLAAGTRSSDAFTQARAIRELVGIKIPEPNPGRLSLKSKYTRGSDVLVARWPAQTAGKGGTMIHLGQQLYLAANGEAFPEIQSEADAKHLFGVARNFHVTAIQDIRRDTPSRLQVSADVTDGFYVSMNRMPFELGGDGYQLGDWNGSGRRRMTTRCFTVEPESKGAPNILVWKWYSGGAAPYCSVSTVDCGAPPRDGPQKKVILYTGNNFTGQALSLDPGWYPFSRFMATGFPNDRLRSLQIPRGYRVYLYIHDIWTSPPPLVLDGSISDLSTRGYADTVSSLIIQQVGAIETEKIDVAGKEGVGVPPAPGAVAIMQGSRIDSGWSGAACLTQEPNAPWLQMEVCSNPDKFGNYRNTLQDKRLVYVGCDVDILNVTTQMDEGAKGDSPTGSGYVSLVSSSVWKTVHEFAFSAFRTLSLCIRPTALMAANEESHIFSHGQPTGNRVMVTMKRTGDAHTLTMNVYSTANQLVKSQTKKIIMGEWNIVLIQYIQEAPGRFDPVRRGGWMSVRDVSLHSFQLKQLYGGSSAEVAWKEMLAERAAGASRADMLPLTDDSSETTKVGCGPMVMGLREAGQRMDGAAMDIAWVHGFRAAFESKDMLIAEAEHSWKSFWYR